MALVIILGILDFSTEFIKEFFGGFGLEISDKTAGIIFSVTVAICVLLFVCKRVYRWLSYLCKRHNVVIRWRKEYVKAKLWNEYNDYLNEKKYQLFIPTRFQNIPPNDYQDPYDSLIVSSGLLIEKYLTDILTEKNTNRDLYCVLGGSGMGKTTFAIHLFKEYINRYKEETLPFEISMLSLSDDSVLDRIEKIEEQHKHILILDALDESAQAAKDFDTFIEKLESEIKNFRFVVITCRTQFFKNEDDELKESKLRNYGINKGFRNYNRQYISPLTDNEILNYVERKYAIKPFDISTWSNGKKLKRAKRLIASSGNILVRPLMLSYIEDLLSDNKNIINTSDMYYHLIDSWIMRESKIVSGEEKQQGIRALIWQFSEKLAVDMLENRKKRNGYFLSRDEFDKFITDNGYDEIDFSFDSRSLVNRNSSGDIKFAHKSFLEYFLALEKWHKPEFNFEFDGMDMSLLFFHEFFDEKLKEEMADGKISVVRGKPLIVSNISNIDCVEFIKDTELRYEWMSELFNLKHVTLHQDLISDRMTRWLSSTGIKTITIKMTSLRSIDFLLNIPRLEVINIEGGKAVVGPYMQRKLRGRNIALIEDGIVKSYIPRNGQYAERKINIALLKYKKMVDYGAMAEVPD